MVVTQLAQLDSDRFFIGQKPIGKQEAIMLLSKYLSHLFDAAFEQSDEERTPEKCVDFVNSVIQLLGKQFDLDNTNMNLVDTGNKILTAIIDKNNFDFPNIEDYIRQITPITSLSRSSVFFGGIGSVNIESELNREILCADEICWVVSFIKISGLNLVWDSLKKFTSSGRKLRVITTTYTGATDYEAVSRLASLPNTEVKVSYDGTQDRLHAKSYIFLRNNGFHTAYIGSSNLSVYALRDGKEWNFKATQFELPEVVASVRNSFESYWADETFEMFIPGLSDERLKNALGVVDDCMVLDFSALDLMRAKDYQKEILEKLDIERNLHGHFRNLVVAATGTGKTVIAAFDFKRFREKNPNCHFLFIAHRQEILKQAMNTFRLVLEDPNFGSIWDGENKPTNYDCVFASKDTLRNQIDSLDLSSNYYDYMIVDEVHHVVAPTYVKLITYFNPQILLGLTATPERMNADEDITQFFDNHISAEIRLPAALNAGLLAPFHYYGIPDNIDLTEIKWSSGGYNVSELTKIYTANDYRTGLILRKMQEYIGGSRLNKVKALCFCVSKEHAAFMNAKFTLAGLHSDVLTSDDSGHHRRKVQNRLRKGEINYLFVVDIFNEGVDIPEIDTVLFLRPTESVTIFLQQFGRGLRKAADKSHLTVLDFVGHSRAEFSYKDRFEALIGRHSRSIKEEIIDNFTGSLPYGCKIILEPKAKEEIIANIDGFLRGMRKDRILKEIANLYKSDPDNFSLERFLNYTHIPLHRVYSSYSWGELCQEAGLCKTVSEFASRIKFAVTKKWMSTDSYDYFSHLLKFVDNGFKFNVASMEESDKTFATMLYYDLYDKPGAFSSLQDMFDAFAVDPLFIKETKEVLNYLRSNCSAPERTDNSEYSNWNTLKLHGVYTKEQIRVALGLTTFDRKSPSREGVERRKDINLEVMFVDIIKEREIGSTTDYKDYAISRTQFQWETQSRVSADSPTAENYRNGANHMLLFVRKQAVHPDYKSTMGFTYLGEVDLVKMEGSTPISILWQLRDPMSESTFAYASQYKAIG